ncbi:uncharacterized protein [Aegilops tauschii subsp. strangulata]|uniref:uncharacterized protein n=1 Tax=Aegilops tauschii subsp. strangulata TaxID=200361 RepID=UPI003CC850C7
MAATTHVTASDQFMPQNRYVARLGLLAFDDRLRSFETIPWIQCRWAKWRALADRTRSDVSASDAPDDRFLNHGYPFSSRCAYSLLSSDHEIDLNAGYIWGSKAPMKVKIFGWLLCHDKLSTMANLLHKTITSASSCPRCGLTLEDATHLALLCPCEDQVWSPLGLQSPRSIDLVWDTPNPAGLNINIWLIVARAILWKLWDSRNVCVFRNELHSPLDTLNIISNFTF